MSDSVDLSMSCPVCLETMNPPIIQCETGHSVCGKCISSNCIKRCPLCRSKMTSTRNFQFEELIAKLKDVTLRVPCVHASRGCKYELRADEQAAHQIECKSRMYNCEGKTFSGWNCKWSGGYVDILQHFKTSHKRHSWMQFNTEFSMKMNFQKTFNDTQVIDFLNGQQLFWYKCRCDIDKKKVYWLFQYVGLAKQAAQYYYEFEIHDGATRKMKITELCENDCKDANLICESEKCVALSFQTISNYLNEEGKLSIRFRIMKIKREFPTSVHIPPHSNNSPSTPVRLPLFYTPSQHTRGRKIVK